MQKGICFIFKWKAIKVVIIQYVKFEFIVTLQEQITFSKDKP